MVFARFLAALLTRICKVEQVKEGAVLSNHRRGEMSCSSGTVDILKFCICRFL